MEMCEQQYGWLLVKTSNAITEQKLYVTKHVMASKRKETKEPSNQMTDLIHNSNWIQCKLAY